MPSTAYSLVDFNLFRVKQKNVFFRQIEVGSMQNFSYLIGCPTTKECAVIDCGFEPEKLVSEAKKNGYHIKKIFLTHVHYDHSGAAEKLAELTGAEIFMNPESEKKRGKNVENGMWIIPKKTTPLFHTDTPKIGEISGKVILAPGHQNDHFLLLFDQYLFTGDVLFVDGIGRTDLPDSDPSKIAETLNTICTLDENIIICPGHDYGSVPMRSLREEKIFNPYLK